MIRRSNPSYASVRRTKGGPGSGHFGHAGRPGKRGGSAPSRGHGGNYELAHGNVSHYYEESDAEVWYTKPGRRIRADIAHDNDHILWVGPRGDIWLAKPTFSYGNYANGMVSAHNPPKMMRQYVSNADLESYVIGTRFNSTLHLRSNARDGKTAYQEEQRAGKRLARAGYPTNYVKVVHESESLATNQPKHDAWTDPETGATYWHETEFPGFIPWLFGAKPKRVIKYRKGGPGSGFHGHAGRPGRRGGSAPMRGHGKIAEKLDGLSVDQLGVRTLPVWHAQLGDQFPQELIDYPHKVSIALTPTDAYASTQFRSHEAMMNGVGASSRRYAHVYKAGATKPGEHGEFILGTLDAIELESDFGPKVPRNQRELDFDAEPHIRRICTRLARLGYPADFPTTWKKLSGPDEVGTLDYFISNGARGAKGGPGSGNFGHAGRPGKRGGSAPRRGHGNLGVYYHWPMAEEKLEELGRNRAWPDNSNVAVVDWMTGETTYTSLAFHPNTGMPEIRIPHAVSPSGNIVALRSERDRPLNDLDVEIARQWNVLEYHVIGPNETRVLEAPKRNPRNHLGTRAYIWPAGSKRTPDKDKTLFRRTRDKYEQEFADNLHAHGYAVAQSRFDDRLWRAWANKLGMTYYKYPTGKAPERFNYLDNDRKGGPGSGNHGHAGRPGKRGGSAPGRGHGTFDEAAYMAQLKTLVRVARPGETLGPEITQPGKAIALLVGSRGVMAGLADDGLNDHPTMAMAFADSEADMEDWLDTSVHMRRQDEAPALEVFTPWAFPKKQRWAVYDQHASHEARTRAMDAAAWSGLQSAAGRLKRAGFSGDTRLWWNRGEFETVEATLNEFEKGVQVGRKGGPGSGNYGHAGRPGKRGGSAPRAGHAGMFREDRRGKMYTFKPGESITETMERKSGNVTMMVSPKDKVIHAADFDVEHDALGQYAGVRGSTYDNYVRFTGTRRENMMWLEVDSGGAGVSTELQDRAFMGNRSAERQVDAQAGDNIHKALVMLVRSGVSAQSMVKWRKWGGEPYKFRVEDWLEKGEKGGPGSGNHGHAGRPGKRGGSAPTQGHAMPWGSKYTPEIERRLEHVENMLRAKPLEAAIAISPETGKVVAHTLTKAYDATEMRFPDEDQPKLKDAIVIHNHPTVTQKVEDDDWQDERGTYRQTYANIPLSLNDIFRAAEDNCLEVRAVGDGVTYALERPEDGWPPALTLPRLYRRIWDDWKETEGNYERSAMMGHAEYMETIQDEVAQAVADEIGANYLRYPRGGAARRYEKGGRGSGNFGHAGRPGKRGGSAPGKGHASLGMYYPPAVEERLSELEGKLVKEDSAMVFVDRISGQIAYNNWSADATRRSLNASTLPRDAIILYRQGSNDKIAVEHLNDATMHDPSEIRVIGPKWTSVMERPHRGSGDKPSKWPSTRHTRLLLSNIKRDHDWARKTGKTTEKLTHDKVLSEYAKFSGANYFRYPTGHSAERYAKATGQKGGPGSGYHGHAGRPGKVGGSAPRRTLHAGGNIGIFTPSGKVFYADYGGKVPQEHLDELDQSLRGQRGVERPWPWPKKIARRIHAAEAKIANEPVEWEMALDAETGRKFYENTWNKPDAVFTPTEMRNRLRHQIFIHNHPKQANYPHADMGLSDDDLRETVRWNHLECRAVTSEGRYILRRPAGGRWPKGLLRIADETEFEVHMELVKEVRAGRVPYRTAMQDFSHRKFKRLAEKTGIIYRRERSDGTEWD